MICPDCGHDNIDGVDVCEACGQSLVAYDPVGSELEESISRHSIDVLVPREPITVEADVSVRDAIKTMVEQRIGCLLILEQGELAGVFSERDVLNKVSIDLSNMDRPVSELMTRSPDTISRRDSIAYAMHAMDLGGYRHVPIVNDGGKATGIISVRDILRFLCLRFANSRA